MSRQTAQRIHKEVMNVEEQVYVSLNNIRLFDMSRLDTTLDLPFFSNTLHEECKESWIVLFFEQLPFKVVR